MDEILEVLKEIRSEMKDMKSDISGIKSEIVDIKSEITGIKSDMKEMKDDIKALQSQTQENTSILKSLEHSAEVNRAEHDKMSNDIVHIAGDVEAIKKDLGRVEEATANNWADIARLKVAR